MGAKFNSNRAKSDPARRAQNLHVMKMSNPIMLDNMYPRTRYKNVPCTFFLLSYNDRATRKTIFRFCYNLYQADPFFVTNLLNYDICEILLVLDSIKVFFFRVSLKIFWFYLRYSTQIPGHWKNLRKRRFWN